MALIKCRDCKREVSDLAVRCPGCGREFRDETVSGVIAKVLFHLFNGVMAVGLVGDLVVSIRPDTRRVAEAWAIGAIITGMFALVTKGNTRERENPASDASRARAEPRGALVDEGRSEAAGKKLKS